MWLLSSIIIKSKKTTCKKATHIFVWIKYTILHIFPQTWLWIIIMVLRKNTIHFKLMADSVPGKLGIYSWVISKIPSWPLLASVTSNFTIHIFIWLFGQKGQELQNPKLLLLNDFLIFSIDFNTALLSQHILHHSDYFLPILWHFPDF